MITTSSYKCSGGRTLYNYARTCFKISKSCARPSYILIKGNNGGIVMKKIEKLKWYFNYNIVFEIITRNRNKI